MLLIPEPSMIFSILYDHVTSDSDMYHASIMLCDLYGCYIVTFLFKFKIKNSKNKN